MIRIFFLAAICFCASNLIAQPTESVIKAQGLAMAKAPLSKDFSAFTKYMHPKLIEFAGGTKNLVDKLDTVNAMAAKFGAEIKKVTIGNPAKIVKYKKELQTTLPQITQMTSGFGNVTLETTLVAISNDNGKTWKFVDTSIMNAKELKKAMPDLSPELVIPKPQPPKFVPANQQ